MRETTFLGLTQTEVDLSEEEINYNQIDPELVQTVRLINLLPGVCTTFSRFGYPFSEEGKRQSQLCAFISVGAPDASKLLRYWAFVLGSTYKEQGKIFLEHPDSLRGFHLDLIASLNPSRGTFYFNIQIEPMTLLDSDLEKKIGLWFLNQLTKAYLSETDLSSNELGLIDSSFQPTISLWKQDEILQSFGNVPS